VHRYPHNPLSSNARKYGPQFREHFVLTQRLEFLSLAIAFLVYSPNFEKIKEGL
jgi:hypothetical protein